MMLWGPVLDRLAHFIHRQVTKWAASSAVISQFRLFRPRRRRCGIRLP